MDYRHKQSKEVRTATGVEDKALAKDPEWDRLASADDPVEESAPPKSS